MLNIEMVDKITQNTAKIHHNANNIERVAEVEKQLLELKAGHEGLRFLVKERPGMKRSQRGYPPIFRASQRNLLDAVGESLSDPKKRKSKKLKASKTITIDRKKKNSIMQ